MSAAGDESVIARAEALGAEYQRLKHEEKLSTEGLGGTLAQIARLLPELLTTDEGEEWAAFVREEARELGLTDAQLRDWPAKGGAS